MKKIIAVGFILSILVLYLVGSTLINRVNYDVHNDSFISCKKEKINLDHGGVKTVGTIYLNNADASVILLAHPLGGSQSSMNSRVLFLHKRGYNVVTLDLYCHGESSGEYKTFGLKEGRSVKYVYDYIKQRFPKNKIAGLGVSLGGASIIFSGVDFDSVIIEETYSDIQTAIKNRLKMQLGEWAEYLSFLLTQQLPLRVGIDKDDLQPSKSIKLIKCPVFIIAGQKDERATAKESMAIYDSVEKNVKKEIWIINEAKHTNFHIFASAKYERKIMEFLKATL